MDACIRELDAPDQAGRDLIPGSFSDNEFYRFNAEGLAAFCHAIEDFALEEANGKLLASFQDFKYFEADRERYEQLAITIDSVEVLAAGRMPRRIPRVRFVRDPKGACRDFRLILYEGKRRQAMLVGQQINRADAAEEKEFCGCYTFSPSLIRRLRHDLDDLVGGRCSALREFMRLRAIDQAAKQIQREFSREKEALDAAMRRLQMEAERYPIANLTSELERGLSRLNQWKTRLPQMLAQAEA